MQDTDRAWELWGQLDPYYGVLTDNKFRRENLTNTRQEFFASGDLYVSELLAKAQASCGQLSFHRALDFGCGVGRLVIPFSKRFGEVVGVDISESMMAEARRNCAEFNASNISFVRSDDDLSNVTGTFDFINSYVVLQHIPRARGSIIIEQLLKRLNIGGVAMLHISLERRLSPGDTLRYFAKHYLPGTRLIYNLLSGQKLARPSMAMSEYSLLGTIELFAQYGLHDVMVTLENYGRVMSARLMGRRT